ncbi:MAG: mechanosensitive ion channel domain-containing protein [Steroidobacteraceae bacterium]
MPLVAFGGSTITLSAVFNVLVTMLVVWLLAHWSERAFVRAARRAEAVGAVAAIGYTVGRLTRYAIWIIGVLVALQVAGLNLSSFALIGGAVGIGLGFGLQNIVSNFVSGVILLLERSLKQGDFVDLQSGVRGQVREIALRFTRVTTNDEVDILVPNSEFVNGRVVNWTFGEASRRLRVPFGVAYGTDKKLVREAALAAAARVDGVVNDHPLRHTDCWLVAFGESSLNFELLVWVDRPRLMSPANTQAKLLWALDDELAARSIEIPFPQRDLHIRTGDLHGRAAPYSASP